MKSYVQRSEYCDSGNDETTTLTLTPKSDKVRNMSTSNLGWITAIGEQTNNERDVRGGEGEIVRLVEMRWIPCNGSSEDRGI
jgi:hypothetical protein